MAREHGTRARYVWGPDENGTDGAPCRCDACTRASAAAARHRARLMAYGRWEPFVDAEPARRHVRELGRAGIGWKRAATLAGISSGTMARLLYGTPTRAECGEIEPGPTGFALSLNHGFDPEVPGREPWDGRCRKVRQRRGAAA